MIRNYLKIAWRQLKKQKMYSVIKIGGFALSIAACILITLYIKDELSYDKYPNGDRLFRVYGEYNADGKVEMGADWPAPLAKALKEDYPEVEEAGRLMPHELFAGAGSNEIRRTDKIQNNYEDGFSYADQSILDMFSIPMVYGDQHHALAQPKSMVISKTKAEKYFPGENPVGKTMILNNDQSRIYKIGGVMKDFPGNSHIHYDFLLTMTDYKLWDNEQTNWGASNYYTYIRVKPYANVPVLQSKLKKILSKYYVPMMKSHGDIQADKIEQQFRFLLQPVADIHLKSHDIQDGLTHSDIRFVWLFGAIACFILIIACINYINLYTAKSANRAREVGLRKVVGSLKIHLINQFLTESVLVSILSFFLGLILAFLILPYFDVLSAKSLSIPWTSWWFLPSLFCSAILVGLIAGLYPSFYLSAFRPINTLKGQLSRGSRNSKLRNFLVVFQFSTSIILIVGTLVIYGQMKFLLNRKLGFDKDQVMLVQGANTLGKEIVNFKNEVSNLAQVKSASVSDYLPIAYTKRNGNTFWNEGKEKTDDGIFGQIWRVDYDYVRTMGMHIISGRNFSQAMASDSDAVVINQAMAKKLGLKEPLEKRITNGWEKFHVIGILEDFNYETMRQNVEPLCLTIGSWDPSIVSIKAKSADMKELIGSVMAIWKKFAPNQPIRFNFLDERFANMYTDVKRTGRIFSSFAILAIVVACLGLFALSAFMAEQRNKEVSIRKVLGATVSQVTVLLSKDFVKLVIIAFVIAAPIAWWAMNKWLEDFAYRVKIGSWIFIVAGLTVVLISLATISFQSIKAAIANPADSLRSE
ncbi:MAG: ABC transporter permease [Chitinophagales bacterium]